MNSLKDADNPLDFIRSNLKGPLPPEVAALPTQLVAEEDKKREQPTSPVPEAKKESSPYPFDPKPEIKDENKPDATPSETTQSHAEGDDKEENFKILRKKTAELSNVVKEKEKAVEELQEKVKKYETGAELPEVLKAKEARIAELERYERIHALKTSPAYKEQFIKPLTGIKNRLNDIAKDYEIPEEVMSRALELKNRKDLNGFLSENFDEVGALEVKQLITQAQELETKAKEAETEPAKAIVQLEESYKVAREAKRAKDNEVIVNVSKDAWVDSLIKIKEEGKIPELIYREGDTEHNKTYVEPVLQAASAEYGKIIRMLAENGLETLPKDVAFALARMVHLAHASGIALQARTIAEQAARELQQNVTRTTRYERPAIGSSGGSGQTSAPTPKSPLEAADMLINSVLSKRSA